MFFSFVDELVWKGKCHEQIKAGTTCKLSVMKWFAHSEHSFTVRTVDKCLVQASEHEFQPSQYYFWKFPFIHMCYTVCDDALLHCRIPIKHIWFVNVGG